MTALQAVPLGNALPATPPATTATGTGQSTGNGDFAALLQGGNAATGTPAAADTAAATASALPGDAEVATEPTLPAEEAAVLEPVTDVTEAPDAELPEPLLADDGSQPWPPLGLSGLGFALGEPQAAAQTATMAASTALPSSAPATAATNAAVPALGAVSGDVATANPAVLAPAAASGTQAANAEMAVATTQSAADEALAALARSGDGADISATAPAPTASTAVLQGLAALDAVSRTAPAPLSATAPTPTPVLGQEGFDDAIGARVGWLADQKIGHAHIRITPDDMGTIEVRLQLDGDRVHASFNSAHAEVRQALENSLGRLREMLGEHGMQLGNADIGHNPGNAQHDSQGTNASGTVPGGADAAIVDAAGTPPPALQRLSLLDTYA